MANIYSQLESAQFENKTSDYTVGVLGRFWTRSDTKKAKFDRGDLIADFLLNDDKLTIGTSGTAASNIRLYRAAVNKLALVKGDETTAEGSAPVALSELEARQPNYTNVGKPASSAANIGRTIWLTDLAKTQVDTGAGWADIAGNGGPPIFQWNVNGPLLLIGPKAKRVDGSFLYQSINPIAVNLSCKKVGLTGTLDVDIRVHRSLNAPIKSITPIFSASVVSIAAPLAAINTQSIARTTAQISTQSISKVKTALNIQSINQVQGTNQWKYTFTGSLLDADYSIGKSVLVAGATAGANNGTFVITDVNHGNQPSITVTNASGVAQTGAVGTLDLQLWSYNYSSAVSTDYVANDSVLFASHTTGANNGTFTIYKINQSGNNIWIYNATGVAQAGVAGNSNNFYWGYVYSSTVDTTYFVAGENAKMASHTTGANNGNFPIRAVNSGGNNIVVYNVAGVAQAGVAGNALPNRWNVNFGSDPTGIVVVAETMRIDGSSTSGNNGLWTIRRIVANTLTVYSETIVAQAASGTGFSTKYKIGMYVSPASLSITTSSILELRGTSTTAWEETPLRTGYQVLVTNALDVVVLDTAALLVDAQVSPAGYIIMESKSILSVRPTIAGGAIGLFEKELQSASGTLIGGAVAGSSWLGVWVMTNFLTGNPQDFSVILY
jgi:hypothetical protein